MGFASWFLLTLVFLCVALKLYDMGRVGTRFLWVVVLMSAISPLFVDFPTPKQEIATYVDGKAVFHHWGLWSPPWRKDIVYIPGTEECGQLFKDSEVDNLGHVKEFRASDRWVDVYKFDAKLCIDHLVLMETVKDAKEYHEKLRRLKKHAQRRFLEAAASDRWEEDLMDWCIVDHDGRDCTPISVRIEGMVMTHEMYKAGVRPMLTTNVVRAVY